jgi:hypothetical protein
MILYTNRFIPAKHQAATRGPVILIRPEYRNDRGLLEHEKVHRRQWLRTLGLHSLLYLFSEDYRLRAEVEAFREQLKHYPDDRRLKFAQLIAENYGIDITRGEALGLLQS